MLKRLAAAALWTATILGASQGAEDLRGIKSLELDPGRCYRIRDVFLEREDVKLYFTDGHLIFAKPVLGRTIAALFLATEQTDVGEILVIPPTSAERQSLTRFLDETILNEKFRNAMMFFTDDTSQALEQALQESASHHLDRESGEWIAPRWSVVLRNLIEGSSSRVLLDLYSGRGAESGFFVAAIRGAQSGRFDVVVDSTIPEQVVAGQLVRSGGRSFYEIWCRFESRASRSGRLAPWTPPAHLEDYRIEARLGTDLHMRVRVEASLELSDPRARAIGFEISDRLDVTSVRINGEPIEFLQQRQPAPGRRRGPDDALLVAILPDRPLIAGSHRIEFEYRGKVVSDDGTGVYFVASRTNWYPRIGRSRTRYRMTFRYPANLELVATGSRVADRVDQGMRISEFDSGKPIPLAGFNLGEYVSASRDVDGFRVEVRATKGVEQRLLPPRSPMLIPPPPQLGRRRRQNETPVLVMPSQPRPASPAQGIERIADESADAFRFFKGRFGDPAMPVTVISPLPGEFGQGFPGLVYASTLSYFERGDSLLKGLPPERQRFHADLLRPHEIAHQWWGNVVNSDLDRDAWIMEALATYSSVLWLEERDGVAERDRTLGDFRDNLLRRSGDGTVEGAGPIVLGHRLRTSKLPEAYRVIVYEKGAWIMHMLRGILGDESFFAMLRRLCEEFAATPVTTELLRLHAAEFVPDGYHDPELVDFFDQWVYGTGIPRLTARWNQSSRGGRHLFRLKLDREGVPDHFRLRVPVEVHTLPGRSLVKTVLSEDNTDEAGFSVVLRNPASRVVVDPEGWILADRR